MTPAAIARKSRAIAHVRDYFPGAILVIGPPGAVILESPLSMEGVWWHDTDRHGPPHRAWERMARSMRSNGLI